MPLMTDPKWKESKQRFEAWWTGAKVDRPLLQVVAPRATTSQAPTPSSLEQQWLDADYRIAAFRHTMESTYFGGDAFPFLDTHIGPGTLSLYLGAVPEFYPETVWYHPCCDDIGSAEIPPYDESNNYWQSTLELSYTGKAKMHGQAYITYPDLIEGLDTLSSLLGNDKLLYYLMDTPDDVHRLMRQVTDRYFDYYDRLYEIIKDEDGWSSYSAFMICGPGRIAKLQCDFSAMIGPEMFKEFMAPYLAEQCARLDHSVYHLDGHLALPHLDILLGIEDLDAIQWTPGAGKSSPGHEEYLWLHKKTREAGKSCMIIGITPEEGKRLVEELGPEGLDLVIWVSSPEEADRIVDESYSWGR